MHLGKLLINVENERRHCVEQTKMEGPVSIIELKEAETALKDMKPWRAIGSTGVVVEMLGAGGQGLLRVSKRDF